MDEPVKENHGSELIRHGIYHTHHSYLCWSMQQYTEQCYWRTWISACIRLEECKFCDFSSVHSETELAKRSVRSTDAQSDTKFIYHTKSQVIKSHVTSFFKRIGENNVEKTQRGITFRKTDFLAVGETCESRLYSDLLKDLKGETIYSWGCLAEGT